MLHKDVRGGVRVGAKLPADYPLRGKWQMIYPEVKACTDSPYYPDEGAGIDFMQPNPNGSYAWNYYHTYSCCMNSKGKKILEIELPPAICLPDLTF